MLSLLFLVGFIGLIASVADWRKGAFISVAVGFLQDPIRKILPEEPVYMTLLVGVFVAATILGAMIQRGILSFRPIHSWYGVLRIPLIVFILLLMLQAAITTMRYGNPMLAVIGTFSYLIPIIGVLLAYYYPRNLNDAKILIIFYIGLCALSASGVYLAFLGFDWSVLKQVGAGLRIYDFGIIMKAYPGFMRSPEVMAWHTATGICALTVFMTSTQKHSISLFCGVLIIFLLIAGVLTGRRKILIEIVLFITFYTFLLLYFQRKVRNANKLALFLLGIGIVSSVALRALLPVETGEDFYPYWQRSMTVFADAPKRFDTVGLGSAEWAFRRGGLLGMGAGSGSQGRQYFGGGVSIVGGAAEGGLGKIIVELGIPGLIIVLWVAGALALYLKRILLNVQRSDPQLTRSTYGIVAFLAANIPLFMSASQVYGDPFVLLVLGSLLGFVLSVPRLISVEQADLSRQILEESTPRLIKQPFRITNNTHKELKANRRHKSFRLLRT